MIPVSRRLSSAVEMSDHLDVNRDVLVRLLVTKAERDAMQDAAEKAGLTLSEWIRRQCIKTTTTVDAIDAQIGKAVNLERKLAAKNKGGK